MLVGASVHPCIHMSLRLDSLIIDISKKTTALDLVYRDSNQGKKSCKITTGGYAQKYLDLPGVNLVGPGVVKLY